MSTLKVDGIRSNSATSDAITLANDGTCTANITNNLSNRNLIINGAMRIAQRATSSTSSLYAAVDRFRMAYALVDENPTSAQANVATDTTPYSLGFTKCLKVTNGNQTSGAGSSDRIAFEYRIEAQDVAGSGWNYQSTSGKITLSFWIKSSVAQNFYFYLETVDGTSYAYPMETGTLSANTWTKVTKTIPGKQQLQFDNDENLGLKLYFSYFTGTDYTDNSRALNTWDTYNSASRFPDNTSTWYTTNDATLEMTGLQLEVGSVATDFEHRSFGQELALCQRYYQGATTVGAGYGSSTGYARAGCVYATPMRGTPTLTTTNTGSGSIIAADSSGTGFYVTYGSLGGSSAGIFNYVAAAEL
jgi:hypothetical protein